MDQITMFMVDLGNANREFRPPGQQAHMPHHSKRKPLLGSYSITKLRPGSRVIAAAPLRLNSLWPLSRMRTSISWKPLGILTRLKTLAGPSLHRPAGERSAAYT